MFKDAFKYYKSKRDPPDLGAVIDFDQPDRHPTVVVRRPAAAAASLDNNATPAQRRRRRDCTPCSAWRCYTLADRPGVLFVRNPFSARGQRYWIARSLRDYPRRPHAVSNLRAPEAATTDAPRATSDAVVTAAAVDDWWRTLQRWPPAAPQRRRLRAAMRWATLGYHHNWDTKRYAERERHAFPADLAALCAHVAAVLGIDGGGGGGAFEAQAAIVNFYPQGTQLAGHTDHSERELGAPLLSFSFGQSAIFLIGGPTLADRPTAVYLRSGDICVMWRQSRLSYHAVPRILHGAPAACWQTGDDDDDDDELPNDAGGRVVDANAAPATKRQRTTSAGDHHHMNDDDGDDDRLDAALWSTVRLADDAWRPFDEYVRDCRINVNVRQVLPHGVRTLAEADARSGGDFTEYSVD